MPTSVSDDALLDAARRVLDEHGWAGTTAERIAREAGISRVTLHRRGIGKLELLGELAERARVQYRDTLWPILTGQADARERLQLALEAICALAEENMSLLLALDAEANAAVFHEPDEAEALTRDEFAEPLERILRDGQVEGTLRSADPRETATVLFNQVGWTYLHLRSGHRWSADRAQESVIALALHGVAAR